MEPIGNGFLAGEECCHLFHGLREFGGKVLTGDVLHFLGTEGQELLANLICFRNDILEALFLVHRVLAGWVWIETLVFLNGGFLCRDLLLDFLQAGAGLHPKEDDDRSQQDRDCQQSAEELVFFKPGHSE